MAYVSRIFLGKLLTEFPLVQQFEKGYTPSPEKGILFTKPVKLRLLSSDQFSLDCKSDLPIMANVFSLIISVDKEH